MIWCNYYNLCIWVASHSHSCPSIITMITSIMTIVTISTIITSITTITIIATTTLWKRQVGFLSVLFDITTMSNHRQSYCLHCDRTLHARTRTWLSHRPSEKQWPNKVLKFDWRLEQLHLYISWHGRFMLHVGRNCSHTSCEYVLRDGLKRQARIRLYYSRGLYAYHY